MVILLIGWLVAKAIRKITDRVLERVGFDRVVKRGGIGAAMARTSYDASHLVATLVYYAILLVTLQLAFGVFGPNPISALLTGIVAFLPKLAVAILIVVIAAAIAAAVKDIASVAIIALGISPRSTRSGWRPPSPHRSSSRFWRPSAGSSSSASAAG